MAQRETFNVSLRKEEKAALVFLKDRYPVDFDAMADVVQRLIHERMVRELGPDWRVQFIEEKEPVAA